MIHDGTFIGYDKYRYLTLQIDYVYLYRCTIGVSPHSARPKPVQLVITLENMFMVFRWLRSATTGLYVVSGCTSRFPAYG